MRHMINAEVHVMMMMCLSGLLFKAGPGKSRLLLRLRCGDLSGVSVRQCAPGH